MYTKLKAERKKNNTPIKELADLIGLETDSAYLKKENGERKFSVGEAIKLAKYYNKTVEELFDTNELSKE